MFFLLVACAQQQTQYYEVEVSVDPSASAAILDGSNVVGIASVGADEGSEGGTSYGTVSPRPEDVPTDGEPLVMETMMGSGCGGVFTSLDQPPQHFWAYVFPGTEEEYSAAADAFMQGCESAQCDRDLIQAMIDGSSLVDDTEVVGSCDGNSPEKVSATMVELKLAP